MGLIEYTNHIKEKIAKNDLSGALQQLRALLDNARHLDEVILQSARFHDIHMQIRLGTVSHAEANLTQNQIRSGLLDLLQEIETQAAQPAIQKEVEHAISIVNSKNVVTGAITAGGNVTIGDTMTVTESQTSRRLRLFLYLFVPLLAIVGTYFWQRNQELQRPLNLKVRIENQNPNPELSEPLARLVLTYGAKSESKEGVVAEALFEGISAKFWGKKLRLQFSANGFVPVDTLFLFENESFVLPVRRNDDLAKITGIIKGESGQPLEGVKISIPCCSALTDASGAFTLPIPPAHQRTAQRLDLFKAGYAPKSTSTPVFPGEVFRERLSKN